MLRPYGVRPKAVRIGESTPRGYERADLHETWQRYLPAQEVCNIRSPPASTAPAATTPGSTSPVSSTPNSATPAATPAGTATGG